MGFMNYYIMEVRPYWTAPRGVHNIVIRGGLRELPPRRILGRILPRGRGLRPLRGRRDGTSLPRLRLGGSSRVRARPEAVPYGMGSATASRMSSGDGDPAGMVLPYQWAPLIDNDLQ